MMRRDVRARVVRFVSVTANCHCEIGMRVGSDTLDELLERDPADLRRPAEIRVICNGVTDLRQSQKRVASDVAFALLPSRPGDIAVEFEIGWRHPSPSEPSVQRFLRRRYRACGLGFRIV